MSKDITMRLAYELTADSLVALANGDLLAIQVGQFLDQDHCDALTARLYESACSVRSHSEIYKTDIPPFFNVGLTQKLQADYLLKVPGYLRMMRCLCSPWPFPGDMMRLALDEIWPSGATILRINGQPMFFGITRLWDPGTAAAPHQDLLRREMHGRAYKLGFSKQIGLNTYISVADEGGALALWDIEFLDDDPAATGIEGSYGFREEDLPAANGLVQPKQGDLILINSAKVHAVRTTVSGVRLTTSGFIGVEGIEAPLRVWS